LQKKRTPVLGECQSSELGQNPLRKNADAADSIRITIVERSPRKGHFKKGGLVETQKEEKKRRGATELSESGQNSSPRSEKVSYTTGGKEEKA